MITSADEWKAFEQVNKNAFRMHEGIVYKCTKGHFTTTEFDREKFRKLKNPKEDKRNLKYCVITSMDQKYFDHCGKAMLKSFRSTWGKNLRLFVYNEDDFKIKVKDAICMGWNLGQDYEDFIARHPNTKIQTFAKKAFSIIHALKHLDCERLIWLDADTICTDILPPQLLELISPDDVLSTHFGVKHPYEPSDPKKGMAFSCETGFFIVNKRHPKFATFLQTYESIYVNDDCENLRRFYDGEVYGETVRRLQNQGAKMMELNPGQQHKTPIPRSIIAPYVSHYKAGLKDNLNNESLLNMHNFNKNPDFIFDENDELEDDED